MGSIKRFPGARHGRSLELNGEPCVHRFLGLPLFAGSDTIEPWYSFHTLAGERGDALSPADIREPRAVLALR